MAKGEIYRIDLWISLITNSKNLVLKLKAQIADCKRDDKDKITRFLFIEMPLWINISIWATAHLPLP